MKIDFRTKELTIKLVYYGPALSGKTTNLQAIHRLITHATAGRLMTLETRDDRTLFFDLLPLSVQAASGLNVRFKLFTVPGQTIHEATRRLVLQGADGVAFIADSQLSETKANRDAFIDLQTNLKANGFDPKTFPTVLQFNKRDLIEIRTDAEIDAMAARGSHPVYKASAVQGDGVIDTLRGLIALTWNALESKHALSEKFDVEPSAFLSQVESVLTQRVEVGS